MKQIYARKIIDENGNEIIELDLNKPWPRMFELPEGLERESERLLTAEKKSKRQVKDFIKILY